MPMTARRGAMGSLVAQHANAVLLGAGLGGAYYVLARAMEVAAVRLAGRKSVPAVLAGFAIRFVLAGAVLWGAVTLSGWHAGALCLGFLTAYTIILGGEAYRHLRGVRPSAAGSS